MESIFQIDLGENGGLLSPTTLDEFSQWISDERGHWAWLASSGAHSQAHERYLVCFDHLARAVSQVRDGMQQAGIIQPVVLDYYINRKPILHSTGKIARIVDELRPTLGDASMTAAVRFISTECNLAQVVTTVSEFQAIYAVAIPDMGDPVALTNRLQTARESERRSLRSLRDEILASDKNRASEWDVSRRVAMDRVRRLRGAVLRSAKIHKLRRDQETELAVNSIRSTEKTYMEHMRLKAPVDYWYKSSSDFSIAKAVRLKVLLWTGGIGAVSLMIAYICGIRWVVQNATSPVESKIAIAALLGLLSTCYFWSLRLITKLYLSEHHLATDAGERSILIQTYLAMIHDGSATDADRSLILASIFRSSSDGVVKDDAGIDPSVFAAFAKLLSPK